VKIVRKVSNTVNHSFSVFELSKLTFEAFLVSWISQTTSQRLFSFKNCQN